jgi:hypothetical protein
MEILMKSSKFLSIFLFIMSFHFSCTEKNPDYIPDYEPDCTIGNAICSEDGSSILVCQTLDGSDSPVYSPEKSCWEGTLCFDGFCGPGDSTECANTDDCEIDEVCTAVPVSRSELGTFCIPPPIPTGRDAGLACSVHDECKSGYCFRRTCFTGCDSTSACPFNDECVSLQVTIDGIKGEIEGCAIPSN